MVKALKNFNFAQKRRYLQKTKKGRKNYSKFWLFCQALSHSYNKVATNGLQARLKLESVLYERKNRWR
ncbi:hypothetical protein HMPREF1396_00947 [Helicobacter pylori GAM114Ai]|nr:hypothetical protein HMPREF1396_00947 [Helicobacter pylori GAM114Ai]